MLIQILEKSPNIKIELLEYLRKNNEIIEYSDDLTNEKKVEVEIIIIRSEIIVDFSRKLFLT